MHQLKKRILAGFFSAALILALMSSSVFAADENGPVQYLDKDQNTLTCTTYGLIDEDNKPSTLSIEYNVVFGEVVIDHSITINGNVKLILTDGCHLKVNGCLSIPEGGNSLTIYAQSIGEETMGAFEANAYDFNGKAGIEVNSKSSGLTICGGNIKAVGGTHAAGIGGNENGDSGNITIYGGKVDAAGGWRGGAGIGGGYDGDCNNVTICGGSVYATGGEYGAGIGGGYEGDSVDTITISGGHVEAAGGYFSAGIGGGYYGNANIVIITGGETVATGREGGSGIGGGKEAQFGTGGEFEKFVFTGGTVKAVAIPNYFFETPECGKAIGEGYGGDDDVTYSVLPADGYLLLNNETGKPQEFVFSKNYKEMFGKESCYVSMLPSSEYPLSYLTQDEYGKTIETECTDYNMLYSKYYYTDKPMELASGWYVMAGTGEYDYGIEIQGDVHLILMDGCTLTVKDGIRIGQGAELTVYGQSEGAAAGKLISYGTDSSHIPLDNYVNRAGIGSSGSPKEGGSSGKLTIHGGNITAIGSEQALNQGCSGIGGLVDSPNLKPVELTMYGGTLTARGYYGSPGIGGCSKAPGGIVNIYGGTINAESIKLHDDITGRTIVGPAIGGGWSNSDNGTVHVGANVVLIDNKTGKQVTKGSGEEWIDKFAEPSISITATTDMQPVDYMYYDEETGDYETGSCEKYLSYDNAGDTWNSGWYVLDGEHTFNNEIRVDGDVHIILKDDCQVTFGNGIHIYNDASLSIHSQSYGDNMGEMEVLHAQPTGSGNGKAGIRTTGANLYVHGGKIKATGANWGAGIGGGSDMQSLISEGGGNVTVYGGQLEGKGGNFAAGIGGGAGERGNGGTLTVIGGTVIAEGGGMATGIGGGQYGDGGTLNLYGGTIKAQGSMEARAIGGGIKSTNNGTINVKEGCILIDNDTNEEIENEDGKEWTEIFSGEAVNIHLEDIVNQTYQIIRGNNSNWAKGSEKGLTITSDAPFNKFWRVKLDGKFIDEVNYTVEEGSTAVTLKVSYLNTLSIGTHRMEIVSTDGVASTFFWIYELGAIPDTGDNTNLMWMMSVLVGTALLLLIAGLRLRNLKK